MRKFIQNTIQSQKVFYRYFRRKGMKRFLKENVLESEGSNEKKAKSIALGIFIGLSPFWGFHSFLAISLSVYFKMNKMLTFMASQITFPPFIPLIILGSMMVGAPFVKNTGNLDNQIYNFALIKENLTQYIIGSLILSIVCSIVIGFLSYYLMQKIKPQNKNT